jgi:hypothetical protein
MSRPKLNVICLSRVNKDIIEQLDKNNIFVCQMEDNTTIFVEKFNKTLDCIMVNPYNYKIKGFTNWQMDIIMFSKMLNEVLFEKDNQLFAVESQGYKMREIFEGVIDALICLKTGENYNGYRIREDR